MKTQGLRTITAELLLDVYEFLLRMGDLAVSAVTTAWLLAFGLATITF
jgi:hypothetical protein